MAILPESFKAFVFQSGIERVREAYRASVTTMEVAQAGAQEKSARYEDSGDDDSEYDEDGVLTHSTRHALNYSEMEAALAVTVVRESFITSAFHYWERSARGWTKLHGPRDKWPQLSAASGKMYPLSPNLVFLNRLNNLLKHGGDEKARLLARNRPDYFVVLLGSSADSNRPLTHRITHDHVEEAFEIVKASGPRDG